jgi:DHA1 family 2-module integral membrane pump EmrD-like MFS transporter
MHGTPGKPSSTTYLILLIMLISIAQCGLSLYLPSLPAISSRLHALPTLVQLTVVYYVIGIGISQLFYGPLSDHYGRRKIVLYGVYIFLTGTVLAMYSPTIDILLMARFIQGIGIGSATTISRAILRDIFQGKEYVKAGSKLASAVATAPIVAPILGGYIQTNLGWRANFLC